MNAKALQQITESKWMDLLGVALVIGVSIALGFHLTVREGIPIGYFSTFGAAGSMMVTRLVTKRNNIGNLIGLLTAVNSAFVDYYLGNEAAFLTYPISFLGAGVSYLYWNRKKDRVPRKIDVCVLHQHFNRFCPRDKPELHWVHRFSLSTNRR